uniref:Gypsy retrotransposon integrase-like protein 1 n=1 Tax=Leptobrachium leishanense TaxID=445787 RepID=A0A8C5MZR0_9ANUR
MDKTKVKAILDWPTPKDKKAVQQFMGFANFYRRFIRSFSHLSAPITSLTKKDVRFQWSTEAQQAFERLKESFTQAPVLKQPEIHLPYYLETDASDIALGAILSQKFGDKKLLHPVAFYSRRLNSAERNYNIGEKELLAIKNALEEWRHLLEGATHPVTVFTDHRNLEYLRTAKRLRPRQARWALFFSRFSLLITYRPGTRNGKADALSRQYDSSNPTTAVPNDTILPGSFFCATKDTLMEHIRKHSRDPPTNIQGLIPIEGFLYHEKQIYAPPEARLQVLQHAHDIPASGHGGIKKTINTVQRYFWWPSVKKDVAAFVLSCPVCARNKQPRARPAGLLQPLALPLHPWKDLSMDFIVDLPPSRQHTTIFVVVDRCTKMAHFIPTIGLPTAARTATLFIREIFRLHGIPHSIVSDRGSQFTSRFWSQMCRSLKITRYLSSAFHPQSNGQTERTNQTLEQYLRCYTTHLQDDWLDILPLAEFAYNNQVHSSTRLSPFYANYGYHPDILPDIPLNTPVPEVSNRLRPLRLQLRSLRQQLQLAQDNQKKYADRNRRPAPQYTPGDKVLLSTAHLRLDCPSKKLGPRFIGPFPVLKMVNPVAAHLTLPSSYRIHPVFHVSLLKPWRENPFPGRHTDPAPPMSVSGEEEYEVSKILDSRLRYGKLEYLVHWKGYGPEDRSWIPDTDIHAPAKVRAFHLRYPSKPSVKRTRGSRLGGGSCHAPLRGPLPVQTAMLGEVLYSPEIPRGASLQVPGPQDGEGEPGDAPRRRLNSPFFDSSCTQTEEGFT